MKKHGKPKDLEITSLDYAHFINTFDQVRLRLITTEPYTLRRMAKWLLRAADYIEYKRIKK